MKEKHEIPKYHGCGNVKYYYGRYANGKKCDDHVRCVTEVNCLSKLDLIKFQKVKNEK